MTPLRESNRPAVVTRTESVFDLHFCGDVNYLLPYHTSAGRWRGHWAARTCLSMSFAITILVQQVRAVMGSVMHNDLR